MTFQEFGSILFGMVIKVSTLVEKKVWEEMKDLSEETHQSLSGMVMEALEEYIRRKRLSPDFLKGMEESLKENEKLGRLLAK